MTQTAAPPKHRSSQRDGGPREAGVAAPTATRSRIIPGIQGLRAIAVLLVVAYHAGLPIGSGYVGVDVFFVISGFVITRMLFNATEKRRKISFRTFWAGRIRRLLPASAAMLVLVLFLSIPLMSPVLSQPIVAGTAVSATFWFSNATLMVTTFGYFNPAAEANPLLHTWSLAVEEQFYLVFPVLLAGAFWFARRRGVSRVRTTVWLVVLVSLGSFAMSAFLTYASLPVPIGPTFAFYAPFTRAWEFGVGALIALAAYAGKVHGRRTADALGVAGVVLLVASLVLLTNPALFPGAVAALPVTAAGLLIWSAVAGGRVADVLAKGPMTYLGDRSYGWYLYHWPVIVFAGTFFDPGHTPVVVRVLAALVGLGLAVVSYTYLEQPIRHRTWFSTVPTWRLAAGLMVFPLLLAAVTITGARASWWSQDVKLLADGVSHTPWKYQADCQSLTKVGDRDMTGCTVSSPTSKGEGIILVGDSNAGVYADAMVEVARRLNRPVTIATVPGCPLTDLDPVTKQTGFVQKCSPYTDSTLRWLAKQKPSYVVVASGGGQVDNADVALKDPAGTQADTRAEKSALSAAAMTRVYGKVEAMGHRVVQIRMVPHFDWTPAGCRLVDIVRDPTACGETMSLATADKDEAGAMTAMDRAASNLGIPQIDVRPQLCPDGVCATNRGSFWVYENGSHLSYRGAMTLVPALTNALRTELARG
ncbi:acyltransferase family protein [Marmoricola sp. RAF53]|uniref:acyltransferase family protein n=1 Tax=Marmoricola sp. RAF53 TaxID=3233059 RepID=UPI003F95D24F